MPKLEWENRSEKKHGKNAWKKRNGDKKHKMKDENPLLKSAPIQKVVFMGAPSTGKTTMVKAAAAYFDTQYVLEYGKEYWQKHQVERLLTQEQLLYVAQEQIRQENAAIEHCDTFLFVDTNALTTWHFAMDYYGSALPELSMLAEQSKQRFDHVFLCGDDIPFEDTWERSGDVKRHEFQAFITKQLEKRGIQYHYLEGNVQSRLATLVAILSKIKVSLATPCPRA